MRDKLIEICELERRHADFWMSLFEEGRGSTHVCVNWMRTALYGLLEDIRIGPNLQAHG